MLSHQKPIEYVNGSPSTPARVHIEAGDQTLCPPAPAQTCVIQETARTLRDHRERRSPSAPRTLGMNAWCVLLAAKATEITVPLFSCQIPCDPLRGPVSGTLSLDVLPFPVLSFRSFSLTFLKLSSLLLWPPSKSREDTGICRLPCQRL